VRNQTIGQFLTALAARVPAPGGGATAALHAAQAAGLVAMVTRYSDGPKYADHAEAIRIEDAQARSELLAAAGSVGGLCDRADKVTAEVRAGLAR
jgi:formiminotetrahydrofolate cyclodeaminase